jgi:anti-anti-sigma factor
MTIINSKQWSFEHTFRVEITQDEHTTTVGLFGDFDALAVIRFRREVTIPTDREEIVVDLTELQYTDMTGLRELRKVARELGQVGIRTHLHGANTEISEMLDLLPT